MEFISHSRWSESTHFLQLIRWAIPWQIRLSHCLVTDEADCADPDLALGIGHPKVPWWLTLHFETNSNPKWSSTRFWFGLDTPLSSHLEIFRSRVLVQVHLGENIRKDFLRTAIRGTGSKTGRILLLPLSFGKLAASKCSCDQLTKQRSSFFLLVVEVCIIGLKGTQRTVLLWSPLHSLIMQFCVSRGCSREKSSIHPTLANLVAQGFQEWMAYECLEDNHLGRNPQAWSFWDRASNTVRDTVQNAVERVTSNPRTKVVFPPGYSFLPSLGAWLCSSLCSTLGAAQVFWVPVLFSSPWPDWSSPAFMSSLICPSPSFSSALPFPIPADTLPSQPAAFWEPCSQ